MTPIPDNRPLGQISIDTRTIANKLELLAVGEFIGYAELSALIGRNVQGQGRGALETARRIVLREHRMVFGVILDKGLRRLNDEEIADTRINSEAHVRRHSKRSIQVLLAANYDSLSPKKQRELNAGIAQMRLHELVASEKTAKTLEAAGEKRNGPLSLSDSLKETMENFG